AAGVAAEHRDGAAERLGRGAGRDAEEPVGPDRADRELPEAVVVDLDLEIVDEPASRRVEDVAVRGLRDAGHALAVEVRGADEQLAASRRERLAEMPAVGVDVEMTDRAEEGRVAGVRESGAAEQEQRTRDERGTHGPALVA